MKDGLFVAKATVSTDSSDAALADAERIFEAFESMWTTASIDEIDRLVAGCHEASRAALLGELIRIDLEFRVRAGLRPELNDYLARFALLQSDRATRGAVAFEHYRLASEGGWAVPAREYGGRFDIGTGSWPAIPVAVKPDRAGAASVPGMAAHHLPLKPAALDREGFPAIPGLFAGHELVGLLGEGAFSRVFLARQGDLARRFVTLKVTREASDEPDCLARLQHSAIVPIYSVHREGSLQAICMPFLGSLTLADLISQMPRDGLKTIGGRELVSTAAARWLETRRDVGGPASVSALELARAADRSLQRTGTARVPVAHERAESERFGAIGGRSFGETAAWLFLQLAEGLEHAHRQGIVHGDIKPANILIGDDGHPLLLDFNLARNSGGSAAGFVGGTLAYMAPEQLRGYEQGLSGDERCDLYSLGLVMHELVHGQRAFPDHSGRPADAIAAMIADRARLAPLRSPPRQPVDHDLDQIVRKCLEPDPARRYPSATALIEDLRRRESHFPLKTAPDGSLWRRARKWARRHPRVASLGSVITVAAVLLAVTLGGLFARQKKLDQLAAMTSSGEFVSVLRKQQAPLTGMGLPESMVDRALTQVRETLAGYGATSPEQLESAARFRLLPDAQRQVERKAAATAWNLVEATSGPSAETAVWSRIPGLNADSLDDWLMFTEELRNGEFDTAATGFWIWLDGHPDDAPCWLLYGNALAGQGKLADAEAAYRMCLMLDDSFEVAWFNLGRVCQDRGEGVDALNAFSAAIGINPLEPASYANRGQLKLAAGDAQGAVTDLKEAIGLGAADTRVWHYLARAHRALGNEAEGKSADQRFLEEVPVNVEGWELRGFIRHQAGDLDGALDDYGHALELQPSLRTALQNRANILAEQKGQPAEAIADMDRIIASGPGNAVALVTRGVLYARTGDRAKAHADAEAAIRISPTGDVLYRAAGVYAQTSLLEPADRDRAIALIAAALLRDPVAVERLWTDDRDLKPVADNAGLKKLREWVAAMHAMSAAQR